MKWYKFIKYFFLPFAILHALSDFSSVWVGGAIYYLPDKIFAASRLVCFSISLHGMIKKSESGPRCLLNGCLVTFCQHALISYLSFAGTPSLFNILYMLGALGLWAINKAYFQKRQHLFFDRYKLK